MGRNGSNCFVRVEMELRGFKASIFHLISILGAFWDFLYRRFAAIDGYRRRSGGEGGASWRCLDAKLSFKMGQKERNRVAGSIGHE
ncbi:hypothetical protein Tco_1522491 [Tanacetum coccineum]